MNAVRITESVTEEQVFGVRISASSKIVAGLSFVFNIVKGQNRDTDPPKSSEISQYWRLL